MDLYQIRVSLPRGNAYVTTETAHSARQAVEAVEAQLTGAVRLDAKGTMNPADTYTWRKSVQQEP